MWYRFKLRPGTPAAGLAVQTLKLEYEIPIETSKPRLQQTGSFLPQNSPEPVSRNYSPHTGGLSWLPATDGPCATDITHIAAIVAGNVILVTRRIAKMASRQILNPVRRAIAQKARPTPASVCFQCQRRWQSKVSQRPGSDRYAGSKTALQNNSLTVVQSTFPWCGQQPVHDQAQLQSRDRGRCYAHVPRT